MPGSELRGSSTTWEFPMKRHICSARVSTYSISSSRKTRKCPDAMLVRFTKFFRWFNSRLQKCIARICLVITLCKKCVKCQISDCVDKITELNNKIRKFVIIVLALIQFEHLIIYDKLITIMILHNHTKSQHSN